MYFKYTCTPKGTNKSTKHYGIGTMLYIRKRQAVMNINSSLFIYESKRLKDQISAKAKQFMQNGNTNSCSLQKRESTLLMSNMKLACITSSL